MKAIFQDETSLKIYEEKSDEGFRLKQFCHLRGDKQRVEEAENPEVFSKGVFQILVNVESPGSFAGLSGGHWELYYRFFTVQDFGY